LNSRITKSLSTTTKIYLRKDVQLPLLDVLSEDSEFSKNFITPLPSDHLPAELATPFLYGMQLERPLEKMILEEARANGSLETTGVPPVYGHLVWKDKTSDSLVGAIGCTGDILVNAPTNEVLNLEVSPQASEDSPPPSESPPNTVLCRGGYRFVVKEVIKTIPFPVVLVDEIMDDADDNDSDMFSNLKEVYDEDDDDDGFDEYAEMAPELLIQRIMGGVQGIITQKLEDANSKEISLLEQSIVEDSGIAGVDPASIEQYQAEEMTGMYSLKYSVLFFLVYLSSILCLQTAVWEVFQSALIDDIEPKDRRFSIAIMAAELAEFDNENRQKILLTRDTVDRLRIVASVMDEAIGMFRARKLATQITDKTDEDDRDLKIGKPQLPPWTNSISKGTRVEYYWNEEYEWVAGEIVEDPVTIVDELLITVRFDDGETHQLPLSGEDKIRWRPE
jgi:hypothetical protein